LARLSERQVLLVIFTDTSAAAWALRCVDVSEALAAGRLHIACGPDITAAIVDLAQREQGLVLPDTLFRPGDADSDEAVNLLERTRHALGAAARGRAEALAGAGAARGNAEGALVVIAPSRFRPWEDAGEALWSALAENGRAVRLDSDDPRQSSPLALAQRAAGASAIVSTGLLRSDLPGIVHADTPWLTWLGSPRPAVPFTGGRDAILLSDPAWASAWKAAGWPDDRLAPVGWPRKPALAGEATTAGAAGPVIMMHDLPPLDPSAEVERYSSHRLLWE